MGRYTKFEINVKIKHDAPSDALRAISLLASPGEWSGDVSPRIVHEFFDPGDECWPNFLWFGGGHASFGQIENGMRRYTLRAEMEIKSGDREIRLFLDWLHPYILDSLSGCPQGSFQTEEFDRVYFRVYDGRLEFGEIGWPK